MQFRHHLWAAKPSDRLQRVTSNCGDGKSATILITVQRFTVYTYPKLLNCTPKYMQPGTCQLLLRYSYIYIYISNRLKTAVLHYKNQYKNNYMAYLEILSVRGRGLER